MNDGPLDPFLDDPEDPSHLLDSVADLEPLSEQEREDLRHDLDQLTRFEQSLSPTGIRGICVDCSDCEEVHYFDWALMRANMLALLGEGRINTHEPAFAPDHERYVSWDYAAGYADAVDALGARRRH